LAVSASRYLLKARVNAALIEEVLGMGAAVVIDGGERATEGTGAGMPVEGLESEICELAGHLAPGECRWLVLLSDLDPRIEAVFTEPARPLSPLA
jgi:hypothetical protein